MALTDDQITAQNFKEFYGQIRPYLNGNAHAGFTPVGTVISVMGKQAPLNYLTCDGTVYNIKDYPELAAYFAGQFDGASNFFGGDGVTTFAVPDLRGEFLRGTGTNSHTNQGSGAEVGVHQDGTSLPATFTANGTYIYSYKNGNDGDNAPANADKRNPFSSAYVTYASGTSAPDALAYSYIPRPTNTSVLYCIAYKNIFIDPGHNYSTNEQVRGMTEDGEVLYEITINGITPSTSAETTQSISSSVVSNINKLYDANISIFYTTGGGAKGTAKVPIYWGSGYASCITLSNGGLLSLDWYVTNSALQNKSFRAVIQYTKTTD